MRPPWLLPPLSQPAGELPIPGIERQANPAPCQAQREEITGQIAEREVVLLGPEITPTDQTDNTPETATTPHNPPRPSEEVGRLRREVRRPVRYQDYECYTLQPVQGDMEGWKMATKNPVYNEKELASKEDVKIACRNPVYGGKELIFQKKSIKEKLNYLDQSGASDYLDQ